MVLQQQERGVDHSYLHDKQGPHVDNYATNTIVHAREETIEIGGRVAIDLIGRMDGPTVHEECYTIASEFVDSI